MITGIITLVLLAYHLHQYESLHVHIILIGAIIMFGDSQFQTKLIFV